MAATASSVPPGAGSEQCADPGAVPTRQDCCPRHGEFVAQQDGSPPIGYWPGCPVCRRTAVLASQRSNIPVRFLDKTLDNYEAVLDGQRTALAVVRGYLNAFGQNYREGRCLILSGRPGTGKTHMGCALVHAVNLAWHSARYETAAGFVRAVRATWHRDATDTEAQVVRRYATYGLLVLDEVGVGFGSESERAQLTELIDARYGESKPTIVITNLDRRGLTECLGERAVDRLRDNGGEMVVFDWESRRSESPTCPETVPHRAS